MSALSDHSKRPSRPSASQRGSPEERLLAALMSTSKTAVLPREADRSPLPLSFAQERLWVLDQWERGNPVYNIYYAYRLVGRLNVTALEESVNEIVRRHEVLRTTFVAEEGRPYQVITGSLRVPLAVVELGGLSEEEREAEVVRLSREEARRPFDLARGPLLRATLLRLGEREYVLLLTVHHIVFDGWSVGIFWRELGALYGAYSRGERSPLTELAIQYADYALWQREWLRGEVLEEQLGYWQEQLAGVPPSLDLPTDGARPAVQSYRGAEQKLELGSALCEGLKALSRGEGVTLFMTLLAAYQVLLHRYTGLDDVVVGSGIANRNRVEIEGLIGFFVNTLVLRSVLRGNPTFRELLARARDACIEAYDHQDIPFEKLVAELQPERDPSRTPLFQAAFQLQNYPVVAWELGEVRVQPLEVEGGTAKFDVSLSMEEMGDRLLARLRYNCDLFDAGTMERMLGHYQTLLEGVVADPDERVGKLPLLTEAEWQQIVVEWNDTGKRECSERCVHEMFEEQAQRTPDAVAVVCEHQQLTYGELNERANRLASYLRGLGVGAEVVVGVLAERSPDVIAGLLAILKAGGAYLPLDPGHPEERLAFMLQDADVSHLLCEPRLLAALPPTKAQVLSLDRVLASTTRHSGADATRAVHPDNLAYVIYTSGSTGKPKGVSVANRALAHHCCEIQQRYGLTASDRVLQFASLSFDASLEQILATLITGAALVLADTSPWTPQEFYDKMLDPGLTVANLPPAYWHELLREWSRREDLLPDALMRLVIAGGDVLRPETVTLWRKAPTRSLRMLNAYGPTETTITATTFQVAQASGDAAEDSVPIGRPLPNRRAYILDKHGDPVPIGVRGELHLGGCCLARGYLGRPDWTAQQFVCDPFTDQRGARMYRTGDLARYLPDGNIEFLGRLDQQVKIRGFRIELGEIETILSQHAAVREAVVAARESAAGDRRLVGYVVPESGSEAEPDELRGFLREKLPPYMVPSAFVLVETLPLTSSGKVDRAALPMPETAGRTKGAFVAPSTPVQEVLAAVWVQVLGVERVGIHDNFFDLGGHSLLATQVISRIQDLLKVQLPLRALFEAPTVAELSQVVTARQVTPGGLDETARILASIHGMSGKAVGEPVQDSPSEGGEH